MKKSDVRLNCIYSANLPGHRFEEVRVDAITDGFTTYDGKVIPTVFNVTTVSTGEKLTLTGCRHWRNTISNRIRERHRERRMSYEY